MRFWSVRRAVMSNARVRGLLRLVGSVGMLRYVQQRPALGPVWWDGFEAGWVGGRAEADREIGPVAEAYRRGRADVLAELAVAEAEYSAGLRALAGGVAGAELVRRRTSYGVPGRSGPGLVAEAEASWARTVKAGCAVDQRRAG